MADKPTAARGGEIRRAVNFRLERLRSIGRCLATVTCFGEGTGLTDNRFLFIRLMALVFTDNRETDFTAGDLAGFLTIFSGFTGLTARFFRGGAIVAVFTR